MKASLITCLSLAAALALASESRADTGYIASLGGGVGFGYGNSTGNTGFIDAELGYEWEQEGGIATALVLAMDYTQLDYSYLGSRGRVISGRDDWFALAPRVRVTFPVDELIGFYVQGQFGANFSNGIVSDMGWGAGGGIDFRWSRSCQTRLGYQVLGDTDGNGFHGILGSISVKF